MRRVLITLVVTTLFTGCCIFTRDGGFCKKGIFSPACAGDSTGYTRTVVAYGDSALVVVPLSNIRNKTEWRFILAPDNIRRSEKGKGYYNDKKVTITGKVDLLNPGHNDWINTAGPGATEISGTFKDDKVLTACVKPPNPMSGNKYYYDVKVEDVGILDPRADLC